MKRSQTMSKDIDFAFSKRIEESIRGRNEKGGKKNKINR